MTLFKALHPRADVDCLYVPLHRGLLSISDIVSMEKRALLSYATRSEEPTMKKAKQYYSNVTRFLEHCNKVKCGVSTY